MKDYLTSREFDKDQEKELEERAGYKSERTWCHECKEWRMVLMETEEKGNCAHCNTVIYVPTGEGGF